MKTATKIIQDLLRVLHPGAVGLIGNHHGKEAVDEANAAIRDAKSFLDGYTVQEEVPTVVISIKEGAFYGAVSSEPIRVIVLDHNLAGGSDDNCLEVNGEQCRCFDSLLDEKNDDMDGYDPSYVGSIIKQVDASRNRVK